MTPKGISVRPTSSRLRETVFDICQNRIEGADVLDLFAGTGAIGFEALSRGANSVTFVDSDRNSLQLIQKNARVLGVEDSCRIHLKDSLFYLHKQSKPFDLIYIDPPYGENYSQPILEEIDKMELLTVKGMCFIEEGKESLIHVDNLSSLKLKSKRACGRSILLEFVRQ